MKKFTSKKFLLLALVLTAGCKKHDPSPSYILAEEFASVHQMPGNDWKFVNNNSPNITAEWMQGFTGSKGSLGFPAQSYKNSADEYVFINGSYSYVTGPADISSWMITPSVMLKNGDIVRFYTRSSYSSGSIDRLQLLLNETSDSYEVGNTPASVGMFTKILLDINPNQTPDGFPAVWTFNTVTISGLNGTIKTRLAFRYVVSGLTASGIGVDQLSINHN
ncbi:MAG: choice-of-anchor J domain-containing protein [Ferruginibacter sp.]